jgi:hypothetical protein
MRPLQVTDSGLAALAQHHTSLTRLELAQCANITDEGIRHLAALTNLTGKYEEFGVVTCMNLSQHVAGEGPIA